MFFNTKLLVASTIAIATVTTYYFLCGSSPESRKQAFHDAVRNHDVKIARAHLSDDIDVNSGMLPRGHTPLFFAIQHNDRPMVDFLLEAGADPSLPGNFGHTSYDLVLKKGYSEITDSFIQHGYTAVLLDNAIRDANSVFVKHLIHHGADPNQGIERGNPLLERVSTEILYCTYYDDYHCESSEAQKELEQNMIIARVLISEGADIHYTDRNQRSFLHHLQDLELVEMLLGKGVHIDTVDKADVTPLHLAARVGKEQLVELLLEAGATVDFRDKSKKTALWHAIQGIRDYPEDASDPNVWQRTPRYLRTIKLLLKAGASTDGLVKYLGKEYEQSEDLAYKRFIKRAWVLVKVH